jgi:competence protein ComEC
MNLSGIRRISVPLAMALLAAGCGGDSKPPTEPADPTITITGVEDGGSYTEAVTITISVTPGTYEATLNGAEILSSVTVEQPGRYVLVVEARNGSATVREEVSFEIRLDGDSQLIVRVFNLGDNDSGGGGDAILVTDSAQAAIAHMMVDAGPAGTGGSDRGYVARRLAALGVSRLEAMILTHAHGDHYLGMEDIMDDVELETFYYNGQVRSLNSYNQVVSKASSRASGVVVPTEVIQFPLLLGSATEVSVLPPLPTYLQIDTDDGSFLNEGSVGAELQRGEFRMFLTGDGERQANTRWRTAFADFTRDLDVLKVGHHGGNDAIFDNGFSGPSAWLDHTDPDVFIISANGTTHPRVNALTRLLGLSNTRTYCTSVHGDIEIRVSPTGQYLVTVEQGADLDCVPGTDADS